MRIEKRNRRVAELKHRGDPDKPDSRWTTLKGEKKKKPTKKLLITVSRTRSSLALSKWRGRARLHGFELKETYFSLILPWPVNGILRSVPLCTNNNNNKEKYRIESIFKILGFGRSHEMHRYSLVQFGLNGGRCVVLLRPCPYRTNTKKPLCLQRKEWTRAGEAIDGRRCSLNGATVSCHCACKCECVGGRSFFLSGFFLSFWALIFINILYYTYRNENKTNRAN